MTYDEACASLSVRPDPVSCVAPLPSTSRVPIPSTKGKEETLSKALRTRGADRLTQATEVEVAKQQRLGALSHSVYDRADLPADCVEVEGHVLYKIKADDRDTCRIAAMGNRLPPRATSDPLPDTSFNRLRALLRLRINAEPEATDIPLVPMDPLVPPLPMESAPLLITVTPV